MQRAIMVCGKFVNLSKTYGASKIVSVGTSAIREAKNQQPFLDRLKAETGLDVKVISGEEEARLVWLGVSSGIDIGDRKAIFLDLGGGSTEIAIGNQYECFSLNTLAAGRNKVNGRSSLEKTGQRRYRLKPTSKLRSMPAKKSPP